MRDLLAQAVEVLGGSRCTDECAASLQHSLPTTVSMPSASEACLHPAPVSRNIVSTALSERNLLFNFDHKRSNRGIKGGKSKKSKVAFWLHEFVCLADNEQSKTPTAFERSKLLAAGKERKLEFFVLIQS